MTKPWFAVSSTAFRRISLDEAIACCLHEGWILEFSSGLPPSENMREIFASASCDKLIHNYFPAPAKPFVLNLASLDPQVQRLTFDHVVQGLAMAAEAQCGFYSIHAGFCMDPDPAELGKPFELKFAHPRERHWSQFIDMTSQLLGKAAEYGVKLIIENNVLAKFNLTKSGKSPTLCADDLEILSLCETFGSNRHFGMLLDTAHLKVSQGTLGFDAHKLIHEIAPYVIALHHSDNDGAEDTNGPVGEDYWFGSYMPLFAAAVHTLEVHDQEVGSIRKQKNLFEGWMS